MIPHSTVSKAFWRLYIQAHRQRNSIPVHKHAAGHQAAIIVTSRASALYARVYDRSTTFFRASAIAQVQVCKIYLHAHVMQCSESVLEVLHSGVGRCFKVRVGDQGGWGRRYILSMA